jgi:UDP-2-acetamido-2,6-beta-L-arabino-hexul-4-ose reductase
MRILVTGAAGFIGKNLRVRLAELGHADVVPLTRDNSDAEVNDALAGADFVFHLAGVNRPQDPAEFEQVNAGLTGRLAEQLTATGRPVPVVFASSTQAALDNPYGRSKRAAEQALERYAQASGAPVSIYRLTNVFGKWARPFYNSAVATFCHQVAQGVQPSIHDPSSPLALVYVDDVVEAFASRLVAKAGGACEAGPVYRTTVGDLAQLLQDFAASRRSLLTPRVGTGLTRALYSTYLSYLSPGQFVYEVPRHADPRGEFVEMLKTPDCGQFSYFTAHPGVTRGEHYHHSKTEKFLVIQGTARFGFRHIDNGEAHELVTHGGEGRIVETIPGWTHDITNVGDDLLIVMLWANEIFDRARPDTVAMKVRP